MSAAPFSLPKLSFRDTVRWLPLVLKRSGIMLVSVHFAREISVQVLNFLGARFQAQGREEMASLVLLVALNFFFEILGSAVWSFALISATRAALRDEPVFNDKTLSDFNQLLIEGVRSLAAILYRLPFLALPGLVEYLRLIFVPHVVLLDPHYREGRADALKRSRLVLKARWGLVLAVMITSLALSLAASLLTQGESGDAYFWEAPGRFFIAAFLTLAINLVYDIYLVALFLRLNMTGALGADVQLEAN